MEKRPSAAILPYLRDDVTIVRTPGYDGYQEAILATPATETVKGRFEYERRRITSQTGEEVVSEGTLFLAPGTVLAFEDKVRYAGREWRILRIDRLRRLDRDSHLEVYLA